MHNKTLTITKKEGKLILKLSIPKFAERPNPHTPKQPTKKRMTSITGLIDERTGDFGFAYLIDMSYKGKEDQFTDFFLQANSFLKREDFEKICQKHGLSLIKTTSYDDYGSLPPLSQEEHDYYMNLAQKDE